MRESRERVRSALKNSGYDIPPTNTTINLAPADLRKEGSGFDLPMALGILGAYGGLRNKPPDDALFVGELSLDGGLRGVRGALPIAVTARANKIRKAVVPEVNAREAAVVDGVSVYPVQLLMDVVQLPEHRQRHSAPEGRHPRPAANPRSNSPSISGTCAASRPPSAPSRSPPPAVTTS